ncbi:hypothetical protein Tco_1242377, partial [Tanacetum coccineum]
DAPVSHVTESKDTDFSVDEPCDPDHEEDGYIGSDEGDENLVIGYCYDAQVGGTAGDDFQREILPPAPGPYYMSYPYDKGSSDSTSPYTKEEWDGIHTVDIGLLNKEFFKDPKRKWCNGEGPSPWLRWHFVVARRASPPHRPPFFAEHFVTKRITI